MKERTVTTCKADGCPRVAVYQSLGLCQKHYFRVRRTGTTEDRPTGRKSSRNNKGYVMIPDQAHPLAMKNGMVYEHRKTAHDAGLFSGNCAMCGKPVTWKTCHVDHVDKDVGNNSVGNLRVTCRPCITFRDRAPSHTVAGHYAVTIDGVTKTPTEWSRESGVELSSGAIRNRLKQGKSHYEAVYGKKITHVKKKT